MIVCHIRRCTSDRSMLVSNTEEHDVNIAIPSLRLRPGWKRIHLAQISSRFFGKTNNAEQHSTGTINKRTNLLLLPVRVWDNNEVYIQGCRERSHELTTVFPHFFSSLGKMLSCSGRYSERDTLYLFDDYSQLERICGRR